MKSEKISLVSALLININIVIGAGLFINVLPLAHIGGKLSFLAYACAAFCIMPIVYILGSLAQSHPESGGLVVYAKNYLGPYWGFLSGWSYFLGKTVSVGLLVHILMGVFRDLMPALQAVPHFALDACYFGLITLVQVLGIKIQGRAQVLFIAAKLIPISIIIMLLAGNTEVLSMPEFTLTSAQFLSMMPIAVFALIGSEASCAIVHLLEDPKRDAFRSIFGGFLLVVVLLTLFQIGISFLLPPGIAVSPFRAIIMKFLPGHMWVATLIFCAVYTSIIGGSFSIFATNGWNLHRLASDGFLPGKNVLTQTVNNQVPWAGLLCESGVGLFAIAVSGAQVPLQNISVLGIIVSYLLSIASAFCARDQSGNRLAPPFILFWALASMGLLAGITVYKIYNFGISLPFLLLFAAGSLCAYINTYNSQRA